MIIAFDLVRCCAWQMCWDETDCRVPAPGTTAALAAAAAGPPLAEPAAADSARAGPAGAATVTDIVERDRAS